MDAHAFKDATGKHEKSRLVMRYKIYRWMEKSHTYPLTWITL